MSDKLMHPGGTMPELARGCGHEPTMLPPTACTVIARFINAAELPLQTTLREQLWDLIPVLDGSRNPQASHNRQRFLVNRALRLYAPKALRATGHEAAAAMLWGEPDDNICAALAQSIVDRLTRKLPKHPMTPTQHSRILAERCVRTAAKAARLAADPDWTVQLHSPANAAQAMSAWCSLTGSSHTAEIRETVTATLQITGEEP